MIHFFHTRGHGFELEQVRKSKLSPSIRMTDYDAAFKKPRWPGSVYIFTDMERLGYWDLELAGHLFAGLRDAGLKTLNDPARVKNRYNLLKSLHSAGLNDFDVYRAGELPPSMRFPVFLRKIQGHALPLGGLVNSREELEKNIRGATAMGIPLENQIVVEYAGEVVEEGLYRKIGAFRVGEKIVPYICGHDTHWHVKTGQLGIASEKLYRDELEIIQTNPHAEHLKKVFDLAEIEFGRVDYGFFRGRIQVFEINTNPVLNAFSPHPSPLREHSMRLVWQKIMDALHELDRRPGPGVKLKRGLLRRYQKLTLGNLLTHTRIAE